MKTRDIIYPNDAIVIVNCLESIPGGRTLEVDQHEKPVIESGTPVYKEGDKYS